MLGASFIGLEVAASLRARNIEVHVVAPEERPMEKILGPDFSRLVQSIHEEHGVVFHLGETASGMEGKRVTLKGGSSLEADFIVAGLGVRPRLGLAEAAGLKIDRGLVVDAFLETSAPGIFAAGDIARWPDRLTGEAIRVEHWVVAERQGQTAALNMLGLREPFDAVPFFWSQHYDVQIAYVGHAEKWDDLVVEGDIAGKDGLVRMRRAGRTLAVASVFRDLASLEAEVSLEREAARGSGVTQASAMTELLGQLTPIDQPAAARLVRSAWMRIASSLATLDRRDPSLPRLPRRAAIWRPSAA